MHKKYFLIAFFFANFHLLHPAESLLMEVSKSEKFERMIWMRKVQLYYIFFERDFIDYQEGPEEFLKKQKNIRQRMTELVAKESKKRKTIEFEQWHSSCSRKLKRHSSSIEVICQWRAHEINSEIKFEKEMQIFLRSCIYSEESRLREKIENSSDAFKYFSHCIQDKEIEQRAALYSEERLHRQFVVTLFSKS